MIYTITTLVENETANKRLAKIISDIASITNQRQIGERSLAYPIQEKKIAYISQFEIDTPEITSVRERLSEEQALLRFLIVKEPIVSEKDRQPLTQGKKESKQSSKSPMPSRIAIPQAKPKSDKKAFNKKTIKVAKTSRASAKARSARATDKRALDKKLAEIIKE